MAHTVAAEASDESKNSGDESNDPAPVARDLNLSREVPSLRADLDRNKILFKGGLPGGIWWLFRFERLAEHDPQTERTLRLVLLLIAVLVICSAAVVAAVLISA